MHNAASDFLSADSAINLVFRRKRSISKSEIQKRIRRNEEYFYDDDFNENQDFSMQTGAPTMEVANDAKKEIKKSSGIKLIYLKTPLSGVFESLFYE